MFLISLANILPRRASMTAFLCLVVAHLEWPLMMSSLVHRSRRSYRGGDAPERGHRKAGRRSAVRRGRASGGGRGVASRVALLSRGGSEATLLPYDKGRLR